jgi:CheY-like chemotaxis protein
MLSGIFHENTHTAKILIAEDEADIALILSKALKFKGFDVIVAKNGLECIEKAENELPDLILLDNMMPIMDGPTALAKLKASKKTCNIPVIMVTALAGEENIAEAQKNGAIRYVVKPFDSDILAKNINQALKSKHK